MEEDRDLETRVLGLRPQSEMGDFELMKLRSDKEEDGREDEKVTSIFSRVFLSGDNKKRKFRGTNTERRVVGDEREIG